MLVEQREGEGGDDGGLVVGLAAPRARLAALHAAVTSLGLEASPPALDAARDASFVCEDADGHVLRVVADES